MCRSNHWLCQGHCHQPDPSQWGNCGIHRCFLVWEEHFSSLSLNFMFLLSGNKSWYLGRPQASRMVREKSSLWKLMEIYFTQKLRSDALAVAGLSHSGFLDLRLKLWPMRLVSFSPQDSPSLGPHLCIWLQSSQGWLCGFAVGLQL